MIVLKPIDNREVIKEFYDKENIEFSKFSNCLTADQNGDILGYCLFDVESVLTIHIIKPQDDIMLLDGILRSTLHVGVERGVTDAFYSKTAPEELFKRLNFIKNEQEKSLNINKLFQSCCDCK